MEVYTKLQEGWLNDGEKVPPGEFGKVSKQNTLF